MKNKTISFNKIILTLMMIFYTVPTYAMSGFKEPAKEMLEGVFNSTVGDSLAQSIALTSSYDASVIQRVTQVATDASMPIAYSLLAIYFVMELVDLVTAGNFTSDQFIKALMKLAVGQQFISNACYIVAILVNVGVDFMSKVAGNSAQAVKYTVTMNEEAGIFECLGIIVTYIIPRGMMWIIGIAAQGIGAYRSLEIIVRVMLAPIGVADIMKGTNSNGFRFIKSCLGIALQGGIMILITIATQSVLASVTQGLDVPTMALATIGIQGSSIGLLLSSKSLAKEIVGA